MQKKMLIDATHQEETRVAIIDSLGNLQEFDFEVAARKYLKGNIFLAKVRRVEPSLQAAFVDYGQERQGFLPFSEIHPDYFRIPVEDREAAEVEAEAGKEEGSTASEAPRRELRPARSEPIHKKYKIQEVVARNQILLVQVQKEERGAKGAALTTNISLPGRYCVFMPNTANAGGVSRRVSDPEDRKRLKDVLDELHTPEGMSMIIRTAGRGRTKAEIRRDAEYLFKLWDEIRNLTLKSIAPSLVYEEADIIKRAVRDMYSKDISEIIIDGAEGFEKARKFMRQLVPTHVKKVRKHDNKEITLFHNYGIEAQLDSVHRPRVSLPSGGEIVMNQTEALVAIDINSGKSTKDRHIQETAFNTNLEAATEIPRQLRLRDLSGLVVIDFIDMETDEKRRAVEERLQHNLQPDRARLQVGTISSFGLLELSRQRLRPSIMEASSIACPRCQGAGIVRSVASSALDIIRAIEENLLNTPTPFLKILAPKDVSLYLLNDKRSELSDLEKRYTCQLSIVPDDLLATPYYEILAVTPPEKSGDSEDEWEPESPQDTSAAEEEKIPGDNNKADRKPHRRGRRGGRRNGSPSREGNSGYGDMDKKKAQKSWWHKIFK